MKLIILIALCFVLLSQAAPINCHSETQNIHALELDDLELEEDEILSRGDPCSDKRVCQIHCSNYFRGCKKTAYFNLEPLLANYNPRSHRGYEQYKAYHMVCVSQMFTTKSASDTEIFNLFNSQISVQTGIRRYTLDAILKKPVNQWAFEYKQLFSTHRLSKQRRFNAEASIALAVALRKFKKACPKNARHMVHRFKIFFADYYKSLENDASSRDDPGLKSFKMVRDLEVKAAQYKQKAKDANNAVYAAQAKLRESKRCVDKYERKARSANWSALRSRSQGVAAMYDKSAAKYRKKANACSSEIRRSHFIIRKNLALVPHYRKAEKDESEILRKYNMLKDHLIRHILKLFLSKKFKALGGAGGNCQCADFKSFYKRTGDPSFNRHAGLNKSIIDRDFPKYFHWFRPV